MSYDQILLRLDNLKSLCYASINYCRFVFNGAIKPFFCSNSSQEHKNTESHFPGCHLHTYLDLLLKTPGTIPCLHNRTTGGSVNAMTVYVCASHASALLNVGSDPHFKNDTYKQMCVRDALQMPQCR